MAKKTEKRSPELSPVLVRMRETQRDELKAAALESGRSMNAEIIHRLEDYARLKAMNEAILTSIRRADALAHLAEMDSDML